MSSADLTIDMCIAEVNNDPKSKDLSLLEKTKLAKEVFDLKMTMLKEIKQLNAPPPPPTPTPVLPPAHQQFNVNSAQSTLNISQTVNNVIKPSDEIA